MHAISKHATPDFPHRRFAVTGIMLGVVALLGVDLFFSFKHAGKHPRSHAAAVRMVGTAESALLVGSTSSACMALTLALLLWLGRRSVSSMPGSFVCSRILAPGDFLVAGTTHDRYSISYRSGGLYGP